MHGDVYKYIFINTHIAGQNIFHVDGPAVLQKLGRPSVVPIRCDNDLSLENSRICTMDHHPSKSFGTETGVSLLQLCDLTPGDPKHRCRSHNFRTCLSHESRKLDLFF